MRLLVDTGSFVTILHDRFVKSLGLAIEPTRISAEFGRGGSKKIDAAKIDDLHIGVFKMRPEKFGVAPLPRFALRQGTSQIAGILGSAEQGAVLPSPERAIPSLTADGGSSPARSPASDNLPFMSHSIPHGCCRGPP